MTEFTKKYLTKYYIFGYCCLAGFGLQAFFYFLNFHFILKPYLFVSTTLLHIGSFLLFLKWLRITTLTSRKKRFYMLGKNMLEKGEYKENFFLNGMYDPCYRVITKDLLYTHNMKVQYKHLKLLKRRNKIMVVDEESEQIFD